MLKYWNVFADKEWVKAYQTEIAKAMVTISEVDYDLQEWALDLENMKLCEQYSNDKAKNSVIDYERGLI